MRRRLSAIRESRSAASVGLRLFHATKSYSDRIVVNDASLVVLPGEIVGLIGPNGSGKSTLLDIMSGFTLPDDSAGKDSALLCDGESLLRRPPWYVARRGICRTFQHQKLPAFSTVRECFCLADPTLPWCNWAQLLRRSHAKRRYRELLDAISLDVHEDVLVRDLSYGEQRQVMLLCARLARGKYMLLDEPLAGLSPGAQARAELLVAGMAAAGRGVVVVDHDISSIVRICTRVYLLDAGRIVGDGPPGEVVSSKHFLHAFANQSREAGRTDA